MRKLSWRFFLAASSTLLLMGAAAPALPQQSTATLSSSLSTNMAPTADSYRQYAAAAESMLHHDVLDPWYPRTIDKEHAASMPISIVTGIIFQAMEASLP